MNFRKRSKSEGIFCLILCFSLEALKNASAVGIAQNSGANLSLTITNTSTGGANYDYKKFSNTAYTFNSGDYIEYDVRISTSVYGAGGIEIVNSDGSYFRDLGSSVWHDQNGIMGHPGGDISGYAFNHWYHRILAVPSAMVGKTSSFWCAAGNNYVASLTYGAEYANVSVTDGDGNIRAGGAIYTSGDPSDYDVTGDYVINQVSSDSLVTLTDNSSPGVVLAFNTANSYGSGIANKYIYKTFATTSYTFATGDYIEYDVKLIDSVSGAGGIEIANTDGSYFRDSGATWVDQNSISGHPSADLTGYASHKWYHRVLPVPSALIGKTSAKWCVVGQNGTDQLSYRAEYSNIAVTNGDTVPTSGGIILQDSSGYNPNTDYLNSGGIGEDSLTVTVDNGSGITVGRNSQIITPVNTTTDIVVADYNVTAYGAASNGSSDATLAIQDAINECYANGGGTVWIPAGTYLVSNTIEVKPFCTLRGDWCDPDSLGGAGYGTVILANMSPSSSVNTGASVFRIGGSAGVVGVTVYYPNQTLSSGSPIPYNFTFEVPGGTWVVESGSQDNFMASSIKDVTLINSYNGIGANTWIPGNSSGVDHENLSIAFVKGTALNKGVLDQQTTDIDTMEHVVLNNSYWASALTGYTTNSPGLTTLNTWTRANAIAFEYAGPCDWPMAIDLEASNYNIGIHTSTGTTSDGSQSRNQSIQILYPVIQNTNIAFRADTLPSNWTYAVSILRGGLGGSSYSIYNDSAGAMQTTDTTLTGSTSGSVTVNTPGTSPSSYTAATIPKVSRAVLYDVSQSPYSAPSVPSTGISGLPSSDATTAIQSALTAAGTAGGGVVYLPAAWYKVSTHLSVPENVELRGCSSIPSRDQIGYSAGTVLMAYEGQGTATPGTDTALITLNGTSNGSGVNGLRVLYPQNTDPTVYTYPFTIRGDGTKNYVVNVGLVNAYNAVDFEEYTNNNHYVHSILGGWLNEGVVIGASSEGWVEDVLSNTDTSVTRVGYNISNWSYDFTIYVQPYTEAHEDVVIVNGASNEYLLNDFGYGIYRGIWSVSGTSNMFNISADTVYLWSIEVDAGTVSVMNHSWYNEGPTGTFTLYNGAHH